MIKGSARTWLNVPSTSSGSRLLLFTAVFSRMSNANASKSRKDE